MKKIDFSFKKNNKFIIKENDINCIEKENKISFVIDGIKYILNENIFIKETKEEKITLNFKDKKVTIYLKEINKELIVLILKYSIHKKKNSIKIEYIIETENNINNIINIEYKKSS